MPNPLSDKILGVVHMQQDNVTNKLSVEGNIDEINWANRIISTAKPGNVIYTKISHKVLNLTLKKIFVEKINFDLIS